jgi:DNA helicase-2/ATP-dependent DNA helicase PcrA
MRERLTRAGHEGDFGGHEDHFGGHVQLVLGPPGTGKTTRLLGHLERVLRDVSPGDVAFVTFTRAAREEAKERAVRTLRCTDDDLVWFRTIHGAAFRLLGFRRENLFLGPEWTKFAKKHSYDLTPPKTALEDDGAHETPIIREDDVLRGTLDWCRSMCLDPKEDARKAPYDVVLSKYEVFLERYEEAKREEQKHDFADLLELVEGRGLSPPVEVAFVDEAQDLSPRQIRLVEKWFSELDTIYVAGDDDQAIYVFQGADPGWILRLAQKARVETLTQSYRVPRMVHRLATEVIRKNSARVDKEYRPRDHGGDVQYVDRAKAFELIDESERTFVLARNWYIFEDVAEELTARGIAFAIERFTGWSPLGNGTSKARRAWQAVLDLQAGRKILARSCDLIFEFIPSGKKGKNLLPRGAKKLAKENNRGVDFGVLRRWGLELFADAVRVIGPEVLMSLPAEKRQAMRAIMEKYGEIPDPKVTLTSIHGAKGREAETVIILPEMSKKTYEAYRFGGEEPSENRVAYVAITRAKRRLVVCVPESHRRYPYDTLIKRGEHTLGEEDEWAAGD